MAVVLAFVLVSLVGCGGRGGGARVFDTSTTLTLGVRAPSGTNPAYGIRQVIALISYEGLTIGLSDGRSKPRVADHWSESTDGLTWHVYLRPNVKFADGTPVDSAVVKECIERAIAQGAAGALPIRDIRTVDTPSPLEVVIHLDRRSTFLLDDLWLPITKAGSPMPLGTGPFSLTSLSDAEAVLTAQQSYYLGAPSIQRIVVRPYQSTRTAWAEMLRGHVDFLYEVGAEALGFMQRSSSVNVLKAERPYAYVVFLNQHVSALQSPEVRRALNAAVDRKGLIESGLQGHGSPETSPVWPRNWAYDAKAPGFRYDPEAALSDFEKAGLGKVLNDKADAPPARLRLTCLVPSGRADVERLALVVQEQLSRFAVDFRLEPVPPNEFIQRVTSGNFDAAIIDATSGPSMSIPYWSWHSRPADSHAGMNYGDYKDDQVDRYLDQVRHAPDDASYKRAVSAFQRAIVQDPPAIFLAWSETFRAVNRRFDLPESAMPDILPSIRLWKPPAEVRGTQ